MTSGISRVKSKVMRALMIELPARTHVIHFVRSVLAIKIIIIFSHSTCSHSPLSNFIMAYKTYQQRIKGIGSCYFLSLFIKRKS